MENNKTGNTAPIKLKVLFWILMGMVSTFFAEVISGSTPFAFFTPTGWLVVFPIYLLHILVLGTVIFRYGRPAIYTLYPAGMIFGMYEAYITKVIWGSADWAQNTISIGGIYILPMLLIVFFFHAFISFMLSITVSESALTSSREIISYMPESITKHLSDGRRFRRTLVLGALILGMIWAKSTPWTTTFLAELSGLIVIIAAIYIWREKLHGNRYGMMELLPEKKGLVVLGALLIFIYLLFGYYMNRQYFPGIGTQALTWLIYALLFFILYRNLKTSRNEWKREIHIPQIDRRFLLILISLFLVTSSLKVALGIGLLLFLIVALSMSLIGIWLFIVSLKKALIG